MPKKDTDNLLSEPTRKKGGAEWGNHGRGDRIEEPRVTRTPPGKTRTGVKEALKKLLEGTEDDA